MELCPGESALTLHVDSDGVHSGHSSGAPLRGVYVCMHVGLPRSWHASDYLNPHPADTDDYKRLTRFHRASSQEISQLLEIYSRAQIYSFHQPLSLRNNPLHPVGSVSQATDINSEVRTQEQWPHQHPQPDL